VKDVAGKVAFVTGGASGIGLGIAEAFANADMKVVIADVREDHLESARARFAEAGQADQILALKLDVTDRAAFAAAADAALTRFGKLHVLVNNAGIGIIGPLADTRYDDWDWGLSVMIGGVVNGIQTFLPHLKAHGEGGHIVNTSSMAALMPIPRAAIYTTAKAAVIGMAESLHGELSADNIGVSAFCPGPVQTNIRESGKTRPERFRHDSGFAKIEQQLEQRPNADVWMEPLECGERVLAGIRRNDLFILTHREFKEGVAERFEHIMAAFPDEPIDKARAEAIPFLLSNAIYKKPA
jgi:NAD(P)-dependent dehydrogenase (short-subunit alcohol dehydrogenase family)